MASGELAPGTGLEVFLKSPRFGFVSKRYGNIQIPGREFGGVRNVASIVILQALFEVRGATGVVALWIAPTDQRVDIMVSWHAKP